MEIPHHTLDRFAQQHKVIKQYIDDLPPGAIYKRINPARWSIHETIAYLCSYHYIFLNRLNAMMQEVNPVFEKYNAEDNPEFRFTVAKTTGSLLHEIYHIRGEIMLLLKRMPEGHFSRVGTHTDIGKMNITQWIEFFLLHEASQLFRIFKLVNQFWTLENKTDDMHIIQLPRLSNQVDELAG